MVQLTHAFCLAYPNIQFTLLHEEQQNLKSVPTDTLADRAVQLWQQHHPDTLLEIGVEKDNSIHITGVISDRHTMRYDRGGIFIFVNKRWISSRTLTRALMNGYQNVLPPGRFPYAAIDITIDPRLVDVNVHPRKEEVSFLHPRALEQLLTKAVKEALESQVASQITGKPTSIPTWTPSAATTPPKTFTPFDFDSLPQSIEKETQPAAAEQATSNSPVINTPNQEKMAPKISGASQTSEHTPPIPHAQQTTIPAYDKAPINIIGQFAKTYILVQQQDGILFVDQHAAHECILFELFKKRFEELPTIQLAFPQIVTLTTDDMQILTPHLETFTQNGIHIEQFGDDQLVVSATPIHLKHASMQELVRYTAGWIKEHNDASVESVHRALRAQMACKAAVKAGDVLDHQKMEQLLRDLETTDNRLTCPHGRPTTWFVRLDEIERKFQRRT